MLKNATAEGDPDWLAPRRAAPSRASPFLGLTKAQLADATGFTLKDIDRMLRDGLPGTKGTSQREGWRFDLPEVIRWIRDANDPLAVARQRKMMAEAERVELRNKKEAGALVELETVKADIIENVGIIRNAILEVPDRLTAEAASVRDVVRKEIVAAIERANFATLGGSDDREESF